MRQLLQALREHKSALRWIAGIVTSLSLLIILVETVRLGNTGFADKTLWDWLELLIVPLLIPLSVLWLTHWSEARERQSATFKARREELQVYFERMTELLLEQDLRNADPGAELRTIARALTLTVAPGLSASQKRQVILFLYDAGLLTRPPIVQMAEANFQEVDLSQAELRRCTLRGVSLQRANLEKANLYRADCREARLQDANLNGAILMQASLREAFLNNARLQGAVLRDTDLRWADLTAADLAEADLTDTDLRRANLEKVNFTDAVLNNTDLRDADVTKAQLETARLVSDVLLPNGERYSKRQQRRYV